MFWKDINNKDEKFLSTRRAKNEIAIKVISVMVVAYVIALIILPHQYMSYETLAMALMLITVHPIVKIIWYINKSKAPAAVKT